MPPPDLPVGIFAGHRIVRPIASGGAGSVLLATSADGAPRALKLVARSGIAEQLFAQEIAALRALADVPQVVHYRAHGETEEWLWLTLEWLEGDTLARVLERDGLSLARTTAVGLELSHALVALHERGIVHRDHLRVGHPRRGPRLCRRGRALQRRQGRRARPRQGQGARRESLRPRPAGALSRVVDPQGALAL